MTTRDLGDPIALVIDLDEPLLAQRLTTLLSGLPGVRLVAPGEPADVCVTASESHQPFDSEPDLTPREVEVLALLVEGASNKTIARRLDISVHTAKFHVGRLLDKLDATGRTDAVAHAVRLGVISL